MARGQLGQGSPRGGKLPHFLPGPHTQHEGIRLLGQGVGQRLKLHQGGNGALGMLATQLQAGHGQGGLGDGTRQCLLTGCGGKLIQWGQALQSIAQTQLQLQGGQTLHGIRSTQPSTQLGNAVQQHGGILLGKHAQADFPQGGIIGSLAARPGGLNALQQGKAQFITLVTTSQFKPGACAHGWVGGFSRRPSHGEAALGILQPQRAGSAIGGKHQAATGNADLPRSLSALQQRPGRAAAITWQLPDLAGKSQLPAGQGRTILQRAHPQALLGARLEIQQAGRRLPYLLCHRSGVAHKRVRHEGQLLPILPRANEIEPAMAHPGQRGRAGNLKDAAPGRPPHDTGTGGAFLFPNQGAGGVTERVILGAGPAQQGPGLAKFQASRPALQGQLPYISRHILPLGDKEQAAAVGTERGTQVRRHMGGQAAGRFTGTGLQVAQPDVPVAIGQGRIGQPASIWGEGGILLHIAATQGPPGWSQQRVQFRSSLGRIQPVTPRRHGGGRTWQETKEHKGQKPHSASQPEMRAKAHLRVQSPWAPCTHAPFGASSIWMPAKMRTSSSLSCSGCRRSRRESITWRS